MRISGRKNVDKYIEEIRRDFKRGNVIKKVVTSSAGATVDEVMNANRDFVHASIRYIQLAEKMVKSGYIAPQSGLMEESSEERKELQRAFSLDTTEKIKVFYPEWYYTGNELFIYNLLEAVFDASLLIERGAAHRFKALVDLYRSFVEVEGFPGCYFAYYEKTVIYIDKQRGQIYKMRSDNIRSKLESGIKGIEYHYEYKRHIYDLVLNDGSRVALMTDRKLSTGLWKSQHILKDPTKEYVQIVFSGRDVEKDIPSFRLPTHIILLLAEYGVNVVKYMIFNDSLLTCDHVNMEPTQNKLENLEIVTRKDNVLRARSKSEVIKIKVNSYNLGYFWRFVEGSFLADKRDIQDRKDMVNEYWKDVLKYKTVEQVLA